MYTIFHSCHASCWEIVYNLNMAYSCKEITYFHLCNRKAMSMLEIWDIIEQVGYEANSINVFWKTSGLSLKPNGVIQLN